MDVFQPMGVYMGVNLRGGDIGMSEHFLYASEIGPAGKQLCGKGMSERMGRNFSSDPGPGDIFSDDAVDIFPSQRLSSPR